MGTLKLLEASAHVGALWLHLCLRSIENNVSNGQCSYLGWNVLFCFNDSIIKKCLIQLRSPNIPISNIVVSQYDVNPYVKH